MFKRGVGLGTKKGSIPAALLGLLLLLGSVVTLWVNEGRATCCQLGPILASPFPLAGGGGGGVR